MRTSQPMSSFLCSPEAEVGFQTWRTQLSAANEQRSFKTEQSVPLNQSTVTCCTSHMAASVTVRMTSLKVPKQRTHLLRNLPVSQRHSSNLRLRGAARMKSSNSLQDRRHPEKHVSQMFCHGFWRFELTSTYVRSFKGKTCKQILDQSLPPSPSATTTSSTATPTTTTSPTTITTTTNNSGDISLDNIRAIAAENSGLRNQLVAYRKKVMS